MKNLKKLAFGLVALCLAFGLVFSVSAFKSKKSATLKYRFIGINETDLTNPLKWQDVSSEPNPEACDAGIELPCLVQFDENDYNNIAAFYTAHDTAAEMFATSKVVSRKD